MAKNKMKELIEKENTTLKELSKIRKNMLTEDRFIKFEKLKSKISDNEGTFLFLFTFLLAVITIKPNQDVLIKHSNLGWIFSVILFLMLIYHWKKKCIENKLAEEFIKKNAKFCNASDILISISYILLIVGILLNIKWIFSLLIVIWGIYIFLKFILYLKNKLKTKKKKSKY